MKPVFFPSFLDHANDHPFLDTSPSFQDFLADPWMVLKEIGKNQEEQKRRRSRQHKERQYVHSESGKQFVILGTDSTVLKTDDTFQINLDVQQFWPEEISIKYVDNTLVVEGKHEEKQDEYGTVSRHFVRRYMVPEGYDENIVSSLSSDGILAITCPKKQIDQKQERAIPIVQTGQPMKDAPENPEGDKKEIEDEASKY